MAFVCETCGADFQFCSSECHDNFGCAELECKHRAAVDGSLDEDDPAEDSELEPSGKSCGGCGTWMGTAVDCRYCDFEDTKELLKVSQAELGQVIEELREAQSLLELVAVVLRKDPGFMPYAHQEIVRAVYAYVDKLQK